MHEKSCCVLLAQPLSSHSKCTMLPVAETRQSGHTRQKPILEAPSTFLTDILRGCAEAFLLYVVIYYVYAVCKNHQ